MLITPENSTPVTFEQEIPVGNEADAAQKPENDTPAPENQGVENINEDRKAGKPAAEPSFFDRFSTELGSSFKDPEEALSTVKAWRDKANAPAPEAPEPKWSNPFEKESVEFSKTLSGLPSDEAQAKFREWVNSNMTDWTKEAETNPGAIILKEMKAKHASLSPEKVQALFDDQYRTPKRNPELDDDEPDPDYDRAMELRDIRMEADAAEIARRLNEGRKQFGIGSTPEQIAERERDISAKRERMRSEAEGILTSGMEIQVDKDFAFKVETQKDGKLTEDGAFIQSLLSNPAQIEQMFVNEDGTWNLRAIATVGMLVKNPGKITEARAKAMASEMYEKDMAEKRGIDTPPGSGADPGTRGNISLPDGVVMI